MKIKFRIFTKITPIIHPIFQQALAGSSMPEDNPNDNDIVQPANAQHQMPYLTYLNFGEHIVGLVCQLLTIGKNWMIPTNIVSYKNPKFLSQFPTFNRRNLHPVVHLQLPHPFTQSEDPVPFHALLPCAPLGVLLVGLSPSDLQSLLVAAPSGWR